MVWTEWEIGCGWECRSKVINVGFQCFRLDCGLLKTKAGAGYRGKRIMGGPVHLESRECSRIFSQEAPQCRKNNAFKV